VACTCRTDVERVTNCWPHTVFRVIRSFSIVGAWFLALCAVQACHNTSESKAPITLTLIDQAWSSRDYQRRVNEQLARFKTKTGIRVEFLPAPETAMEQIATWRKLLESGAKAPDVYGIDVIWPEILADNLVDLKSYIPEPEITAYFPELIANNTVNGRLVALPSNLSEGLLFYRVDLLREYGFHSPPQTWQELEIMARRIQAGERAKGVKDF
jgi:trehalose/maltose transport system substrate-binding protein